MSKNVQKVKNSLKFKAQVKEGLISVRIGVKKYVVPVQARILSDDNYVFLSFPACSELYRVTDKDLVAMNPDEDATEAYSALNPGRRRGRRRASGVEMPPDLASALRNLPAGYRIGYDPSTGVPRLVRKRTRRKGE